MGEIGKLVEETRKWARAYLAKDEQSLRKAGTATGTSYGTIRNFAGGKGDVRVATVDKIREFLKRRT